MIENLTGVQVQYFTPPEFAEAVRVAIAGKGTQSAVSEMLGIKQNNLASIIHRAKHNTGCNFALLARAYETVVDCYDIGRRHNGDVFVVWGEVETGHKTDDSRSFCSEPPTVAKWRI